MEAYNPEVVLSVMDQNLKAGDTPGAKAELYKLTTLPLSEDQSKKAQILGRYPAIWESVFLDAANADRVRDLDPEGSERELSQSLAGARILGMLDPEKAPVLYQHFAGYAERARIFLPLTGQPYTIGFDPEKLFAKREEPTRPEGVSASPLPVDRGIIEPPADAVQPASQTEKPDAGRPSGNVDTTAPPEPAPEPVAATTTQEKQPDPLEERAERLVRSISYAEFGSFQEYMYVANRNGGQFDLLSTYYGSHQGVRGDDDLVQKQENSDRTISTVLGLMIYNHIPLPISSSSERIPYGLLYCLIGEKDGRYIVQGGGTIHRDQVKRPNDSSFKLVFTSKAEFDDFVDWLKESPSEALNLTVQKLIENSGQKPLSPQSGRGLLNVYSKLRWIGKLSIANVDTPETVVKDFKEPLLHQERIDMVKNEIRVHGTLQEARNVYQKRTQDSDQNFRELAKWMLSIINAYEAEYGQPASHEQPPHPELPDPRVVLNQLVPTTLDDSDPAAEPPKKKGGFRFRLPAFLGGKPSPEKEAEIAEIQRGIDAISAESPPPAPAPKPLKKTGWLFGSSKKIGVKVEASRLDREASAAREREREHIAAGSPAPAAPPETAVPPEPPPSGTAKDLSAKPDIDQIIVDARVQLSQPPSKEPEDLSDVPNPSRRKFLGNAQRAGIAAGLLSLGVGLDSQRGQAAKTTSTITQTTLPEPTSQPTITSIPQPTEVPPPEVKIPPKAERILYPSELTYPEVRKWIGKLRDSHDAVLTESAFTKELALLPISTRQEVLRLIAQAHVKALIDHYGNTEAIIGLDPGHGGSDSGSSAFSLERTTILEKDLAWQLAQEIAGEVYEQTQGKYIVVMLRPENPKDEDLDRDGIISPIERIQKRKALLLEMEERLRPDNTQRGTNIVYLSLHFNGSSDPTQIGSETYWPNHFAVKSDKHQQSSRELAKSIQREIISDVRKSGNPIVDRGAKQDPDQRQPLANSEIITGPYIVLGSPKLDRTLV